MWVGALHYEVIYATGVKDLLQLSHDTIRYLIIEPRMKWQMLKRQNWNTRLQMLTLDISPNTS